MWFTPNKPEQPLWGMKLQEKKEEKDEKDIGELLWKRVNKKKYLLLEVDYFCNNK